jgi:hypothetical protein
VFGQRKVVADGGASSDNAVQGGADFRPQVGGGGQHSDGKQRPGAGTAAERADGSRDVKKKRSAARRQAKRGAARRQPPPGGAAQQAPRRGSETVTAAATEECAIEEQAAEDLGPWQPGSRGVPANPHLPHLDGSSSPSATTAATATTAAAAAAAALGGGWQPSTELAPQQAAAVAERLASVEAQAEAARREAAESRGVLEETKRLLAATQRALETQQQGRVDIVGGSATHQLEAHDSTCVFDDSDEDLERWVGQTQPPIPSV